MSNDLVAYSRAGDVFHYRWAARRCLKLIYPNSCLTGIYIEGSPETEKAGEYVIDVSEYSIGDAGKKKIDYYQLKHTTVQRNEPFTISDLKDTFTGFAARYLQHKKEHNPDVSAISFTVITNRKVADSFKANLSAIIKKEKVDPVFKRTIEGYTNLSEDGLVSFCCMLHLEDGEGDYNIQKSELRLELAQLIAGSIENAQIENLVALVQEKVLPDADGSINREDVLKRFGITSEKELYPAPAKWDDLVNLIERSQHSILQNTIAGSSHPVIVHAAGGVGKSVFCRQLINSLPEGSLGIAYDSFGAGSFRNRSESRHKHRDALVQIANELASKGLCDPLVVQNTTLDEDIMRKFLQRLETSVESLKKVTDRAQLIILIDAADNAEMAAKKYTQSCFAHELLRENMPSGCKLVLLCRTERIHLLQPQSFITRLELEPFSEGETLTNLEKWFPEANEKDGAEFHRLTSGNPRVQANTLDVKYDSIHELLASLGPSGISVEKQIERQIALFRSNIDLLTTLQSKEKVQEIAFKRLLSSRWNGSENVYSASLLSGISDYRGEGRGYLRAAMNWLRIQFEEQRKNDDRYNQDGVQDDDVLELAYAHLNIHGVSGCTDFLFGLKPKEALFRTVQDLAERLVDMGRFDEINDLISQFIQEPYYLVATVRRLVEIGKFPQANEIETYLNLLCFRKSRIKKSKDFFNDRITPAIISFLEGCLYRGLPRLKILMALNHYVPLKANRMVYSTHSSDERTIYLKALAICAVLLNKPEVDIEAISPDEFSSKKKNHELDNDFKEFKEVIYGLFPWYLLRAQILFDKQIKILDIVDSVNETSIKARTNRYRSYDMLPYEIAHICADILMFCQQGSKEDITEFYQRFLHNDKAFRLKDKSLLFRAACRTPHLLNITQPLEHATYELTKTTMTMGLMRLLIDTLPLHVRFWSFHPMMQVYILTRR